MTKKNKKLLMYGGIAVGVLVVAYLVYKFVLNKNTKSAPAPVKTPEQLARIERIKDRINIKDAIARACEKYPEKCQELRNRNK
jgi:hypothetical protein